MSIRFINDWTYLFNPLAIGGRFASFTFFRIAWMHVQMPEVDGFNITILGLGITIGPKEKLLTNQ